MALVHVLLQCSPGLVQLATVVAAKGHHVVVLDYMPIERPETVEGLHAQRTGEDGERQLLRSVALGLAAVVEPDMSDRRHDSLAVVAVEVLLEQRQAVLVGQAQFATTAEAHGFRWRARRQQLVAGNLIALVAHATEVLELVEDVVVVVELGDAVELLGAVATVNVRAAVHRAVMLQQVVRIVVDRAVVARGARVLVILEAPVREVLVFLLHDDEVDALARGSLRLVVLVLFFSAMSLEEVGGDEFGATDATRVQSVVLVLVVGVVRQVRVLVARGRDAL